MPSWRKVIVSGSDAILSSVTASFQGNLTGTASFASTAPYSGITGTIPTWNQNTTGNAATATTASFASTAPYSGLTGTVPTWNQNTTGNAATATTASFATSASNARSAITASTADNFFIRGNVGINTTSPAERLHVSGNIYLGTGNQSIHYRTATNWDYYLDATNDDFRIYDSDTTYFIRAVYNGGTTNKYLSLLNTLTVRNNGNVGIGTTNPTLARLQILGNVSASAYTGSLFGTASFAVTASHAHKAKLADSASFVLVTYNDQPPQASQYWLTVADTFGTKHTSLLSDSRLSYFTDNGTLYSPSFSGSFTGSISNAVSASFAPNFANQNLSLNGDRTHNLNGNNLTFTATNDESIVFNHSSGGTFEINGSPTIQTTGQLLHSIVSQTGNIGIGTQTTTARLHVSGTSGVLLRVQNGSTSALMVSSSGNVGIGTANPTAKLSVSGSSDVLIAKGSGSTSNTTILAVDGNNGRLFEVSDDLSDSLFSVNTIAGLPVMEAFADYTVVMGSYNKSDLVVTGSKIGIGTPNPQRKLDVYDSGSQIVAQFSSSNATSTRIKFSDANTGAENVNVGAIGTRFAVWTNNTERLSILSGGSVGIGSSAPGHALSVLGTVSASAFLGLVTNATSASFATSASYANNAGNAATANFATTATSASFASTAPYSGLTGTVPTWNQNTTGNAATATTASFADTAPYSGLTGTVPTWNQNTTGNAATATSASFATSASNARSAITASSADTFYVRGSIGIGIINPTSKLHISGGNGYIDGNLTVTGTITAQELYVQYISSSTIYSTGSNKFGDATNDNQFFTGSILQSGSLAYFSGNVGIGTASPNANLEINPGSYSGVKAIISNGTNGQTGEVFQRWAYTSTTPTVYRLDLKQTVTSNVVRYNFSMINSSTTYDDVLVLDRGNVGIGTTNPSNKLEIVGGVTATSFTGSLLGNASTATSATSATSASFAPNFANTNLTLNNNRTHNLNSNSLTFTATNDESVVFNQSSGGSFEINGSPTIQTTGDIQHSGSGYFTGNIGVGTTATTTARLHVSASTGNIIRATAAGSDILVVSSSGNVGIGTSTFYQTLTVNRSNSGGAGGYLRLENTVGGAGANVGVDFATLSPEFYSAGTAPVARIFATDIDTYSGRLDINLRGTGVGGTLANVLTAHRSTNVGIGSTAPTQKLDVNGAIKATLANTNQANAVMYNSGTGLLTYVSTGSIGVGTATNADNIFVSEDATNAAQPVLFASNTEAYYRARGDKNDFNYNPATNTLTVVTLNAQEKSFSIPHQGLPGKKLVYGVVEGPEHSVYVRGKSTERVIELPQEWEWLVDEDSITVSLTPIGEPNAIYVEEIADNKIYVNSNAGTFKYFYHVYATRKDVKPLKTIQ